MATYDIGDVVTVSIAIRDSTGALADATSVSVTFTLPDLTVAGPFTATHGTIGQYSYAYTTSQAGRHLVKWTATGTNAGIEPDVFDVAPADPHFLISIADAKDACNIAPANITHDAELRLYLAAATVVIENIAGDQLPDTYVYTTDGGETSILLPDAPISGVTSIKVGSVTLNPASYTVNLPSGIVYGWPSGVMGGYLSGIPSPTYASAFLPGIQNVQVTYTVGSTSIPPDVVLATRELVRHWYQRGQQSNRPAFGAAGDPGTTYVAGYAIPNFVIGMLGARQVPIGFG